MTREELKIEVSKCDDTAAAWDVVSKYLDTRDTELKELNNTMDKMRDMNSKLMLRVTEKIEDPEDKPEDYFAKLQAAARGEEVN